MAEPTAAHSRELGDYMSMVRRRWGWVAGCVLAGLLLGYAYLAVAEVRYSSTAKVLVAATGSSTNIVGARTNDAINLDTEAQLVRSEPVAARAAELLGSDQSPVALAKRVSVTVPPNTTVLAISYAAGSAADAQLGAETFARAYIENRQEVAQANLDAQVDRLQTQIEQTTQNIQDATVALERLTGAGKKADRAFVLARRAALSSQLASYNNELAPLVGEEVHGGDIIVDAQLPKRPIDPNPLLILPAGLMLGLVVGLALAAWRERSDKRIHTRAELERLFGVVPTATLSGAARVQGSSGDHDVVALYHELRADGPDENEVVTLVGPDAPDTAEHLAYSLAVVGALSGSETTFVIRPGSPLLLERDRTRVEKTGALQLPDYADLGVLVDGEFRPAQLRQQLGRLTSEREFVILGLPNDEPSVDLPMLARHVDVAVVVIRLGVSRRGTVAAVLGSVSKFGVDRVVTVTVDRGRRRERRRSAAEAELRPVPTEPTTVSEPTTPSGEPRSSDRSRQAQAAVARDSVPEDRTPVRDDASRVYSARNPQ